VKINLNVLGTLMLNGVGRHVYSADVVAVNQGGLAQGRVKLSKQLTQPGCLSHDIGDSTILRFGT
jgi:hypothetical protein